MTIFEVFIKGNKAKMHNGNRIQHLSPTCQQIMRRTPSGYCCLLAETQREKKKQLKKRKACVPNGAGEILEDKGVSGENRNSKSDLHLSESHEYILGITEAIRCLIRRPAKKDGLPTRPAPALITNAGLFTLISEILHSPREPRKGQRLRAKENDIRYSIT